MNTHIARFMSGLAIAGTLASGAWLGMAVGHADPSYDRFDQRSFPCQEDEVLGYAPQFGPDRVGCIPVEDFLR
jgi:hypothetical protein